MARALLATCQAGCLDLLASDVWYVLDGQESTLLNERSPVMKSRTFHLARR